MALSLLDSRSGFIATARQRTTAGRANGSLLLAMSRALPFLGLGQLLAHIHTSLMQLLALDGRSPNILDMHGGQLRFFRLVVKSDMWAAAMDITADGMARRQEEDEGSYAAAQAIRASSPRAPRAARGRRRAIEL